MPGAPRGVAVNSAVAQINILNIFASSFGLSYHMGPGRLEKRDGWRVGRSPQTPGVGGGQQRCGWRGISGKEVGTDDKELLHLSEVRNRHNVGRGRRGSPRGIELEHSRSASAGAPPLGTGLGRGW